MTDLEQNMYEVLKKLILDADTPHRQTKLYHSEITEARTIDKTIESALEDFVKKTYNLTVS